jgi:hypothetical protein
MGVGLGCPLDAARLQLIRIYGRNANIADWAQALASEILERAAQNATNVTTPAADAS